MKVEDVAAICHEANRAYCVSLGDNSQAKWKNAPEWQRASMIDGVRFHLKDTRATPEDSHRNWLRVKELDGWVYGPVKSAEKKTHPCMLPYDQLPVEQQVKDHIIKAIVRACAPFVDLGT